MPVSPVPIALVQPSAQAAAYSQYALQRPEDLQIVAVAAAQAQQRYRLADRHSIPTKRQFPSWQALLDAPPLADLVILGGGDVFDPARHCLQGGYHVLLEAPLMLETDQVLRLMDISHQTGRAVFVNTWLQHTAFYRTVKELMGTGRLGRLLSIQHARAIAPWQTAHWFIRQPTPLDNPLLMQEGLQELDLLLWLHNDTPQHIASMATPQTYNLQHGPRTNLPARCADDCPVEGDCAYSSLGIYLERRLPGVPPSGWPHHDLLGDAQDDTPENIVALLESSPWGDCVYHAHQQLISQQTILLDSRHGNHITLTLDSLGAFDQRRTTLIGEYGTLQADFIGPDSHVTFYDHADGHPSTINMRLPLSAGPQTSGLLGHIVKTLATDFSAYHLTQHNLAAYIVAQATQEAYQTHQLIEFTSFLARFRKN